MSLSDTVLWMKITEWQNLRVDYNFLSSSQIQSQFAIMKSPFEVERTNDIVWFSPQP